MVFLDFGSMPLYVVPSCYVSDSVALPEPYTDVRLLTQLELEERHATADGKGEVHKWQEKRG
jgi:hypothetical protein